MELEASSGQSSWAEFGITSFLSKPLVLADAWKLAGIGGYRWLGAQFDGMPAGGRVNDADLHELQAIFVALNQPKDSRGSLAPQSARGERAMAKRSMSTTSFTTLGAIGAYRVSESLSLGFGAVANQLGARERVFPGPFVRWDGGGLLSFALYGPIAQLTWQSFPSICLELRGQPEGGAWNISDRGVDPSRNLELGAYSLGLYMTKVFAAMWRLEVGASTLFGGALRYLEPSGSTIYREDLGTGAFASVALAATF